MAVPLIAGVDEAGRGPIAGPVVAGAVLVPDGFTLPGLADSKQLSESARERLFEQIRQTAVAWAIGWATPREIERWNILQASLLAMQRAIEALPYAPRLVLIDGRFCIPDLPLPQQAIVDGDALHPAISAASIVAKVVRDRLMSDLDRLCPQYGFAQHKGYPTPEHLRNLQQYGASPLHRRTFAPVAQYCLEWEPTPQG